MSSHSRTLVSATEPGALMPPPPARAPKRRSVEVLDEDSWTNTMEAIIERDFFPELSKLESKVEWLQAVRSGDPVQIRQAQMNIARRRADARPLTGAGATPAGALFTPGGTAARLMQGATPYIPSATPGLATVREDDGDEGGEGGVYVPAMSLDAFCATHTSEDNASFEEILEKTNRKRRAARAAAGADPRLLVTDGREKTDGFGTGGQPTDTLIGWKYDPTNALMYFTNREVVPYTERELTEMVQGPPKAITHRNTRFPKPAAPGADTPSTSGDTTSTAGAAAAGAGGGARAVAAAAIPAGTRGYGVLATPSFDPGVDVSPFVTWGDIQATPLRIEAEDLPPGPLNGPASFRMHDISAKERRGRELATKAGTNIRRKTAVSRGGTPLTTGAAAAAAAARRATGGGGLSARGAAAKPLSEAARRLASNIHRKSGAAPSGADAALRASYRSQTPGSQRGSAAASAGGSGWASAAATPSRAWTPAATPTVHHARRGPPAPAAAQPRAQAAPAQAPGEDLTLTDDLLNI